MKRWMYWSVIGILAAGYFFQTWMNYKWADLCRQCYESNRQCKDQLEKQRTNNAGSCKVIPFYKEL